MNHSGDSNRILTPGIPMLYVHHMLLSQCLAGPSFTHEHSLFSPASDPIHTAYHPAKASQNPKQPH